MMAPEIREIRASRFKVLPLWSWTLASATLAEGEGQWTGFGFDASASVAKEKAASEALERYVFAAWNAEGRSPFSGEAASAPPPASGFAAHTSRAVAEELSFLEWRERVALKAAGEGALQLHEVAFPGMGLLFWPALARLRCVLRTFQSDGPPFVAFSFVVMDDSGVIFGSGCRPSSEKALWHSVAECLRKLAFVGPLVENGGAKKGPLSDWMRFWLSKPGLDALEGYIGRASGCMKAAIVLPSQVDANRAAALRLGDRWVCHYWDPAFPLPEPGRADIPLV